MTTCHNNRKMKWLQNHATTTNSLQTHIKQDNEVNDDNDYDDDDV